MNDSQSGQSAHPFKLAMSDEDLEASLAAVKKEFDGGTNHGAPREEHAQKYILQ